jgi:putative phosphoribosyl transferase
MIFYDRRHAGKLLAQKLKKYQQEEPIILALPRGGVPVAFEVAKELDAPLDVLVVRKIGAPFQPELAVGAICEGEAPYWNTSILDQLGLRPDDLAETVSLENKKVKRQIKMFRHSQRLPSFARKTAIIVDDGLATGTTMEAAVQYLKKHAVGKVVIAIPIAAESSATQLRSEVDDLVAFQERDDLMSIGQWFQDFSQVKDEDVLELLRQNPKHGDTFANEIDIPIGNVTLKGNLTTFPSMKALIIFAHGSGSSRLSPRNQQVARYLNERGFGTFLFDLLTDLESVDRRNVFDIEFLSGRLASTTRWLRERLGSTGLPFGYFGASTGAGAAIQAASQLSGHDRVYAIVSRGGRPDLAGDALAQVEAPVLLLVGGQDFGVIELNQQAQKQIAQCELSIVPGATHLFEEPGTLEEVSKQAVQWFREHLPVDAWMNEQELRSPIRKPFGPSQSRSRMPSRDKR